MPRFTLSILQHWAIKNTLKSIQAAAIWRLPLRVLFSSSFMLSLYAAQAPAETIDYLVIQKQNEPMQIVTNDSYHSGIITDVVAEIFKDSEHSVVIHAMPFKAMQPAIDAGKVHNWLTVGSKNWSPPQNINLTKKSILTEKSILLLSKKSNFSYRNIESLFDKTLVLIVGFDYPGLDTYLANQQIHHVRLVNYKRVFMELLSSNRFAGFVETDVRARYQLNTAHQQGMRVSAQDFNRIDFSDVVAPYDIYFASDPNMSPALKNFIDSRIERLHKDGTIEEIISRYR